MKRKNLIIPLLFLFISISFGYTTHDTVKYVYDGDTITLNNDDKVRYIGIDTPEIGYNKSSHEHMALQSRNMNINLVRGRRIHLDFDTEKRDRHGRLLAYVFQENGDMVNSLLLKHGLAWIMITPPEP